MKSIAHLLLAAVICAAATWVAAETAGTRSIAPKEAHSPVPKLSMPGAGPLPEASPAETGRQEVQAECRPNWTAKKYKSFVSLQSEIKKRYGEVRILRVALCGEGAAAYFQVVILSGRGLVSRIQITASN